MADLHRALPQTYTPEALAKWILDNNIEKVAHTTRIDLDDDVIDELQEKSSLASRALDRLEAIKKQFNDVLKEGTPTEAPESALDEPVRLPFTITIPPTRGTKELKANRKFADMQIENGYKEDVIDVYLIPYPEESMIIPVTIEGEEFVIEGYPREMTVDEVNQHKPLLKGEKKPKPPKEPKEPKNFMTEEEVDL